MHAAFAIAALSSLRQSLVSVEVESKAGAEVSSPCSLGVLRHTRVTCISMQSHSCKWVCLVMQRHSMKSSVSGTELTIQCITLDREPMVRMQGTRVDRAHIRC